MGEVKRKSREGSESEQLMWNAWEISAFLFMAVSTYNTAHAGEKALLNVRRGHLCQNVKLLVFKQLFIVNSFMWPD